MTQPMKIPSEAEIEAGISEAGGFSRATLAKWGVPWPPPKGWRKALKQRNRQHKADTEPFFAAVFNEFQCCVPAKARWRKWDGQWCLFVSPIGTRSGMRVEVMRRDGSFSQITVYKYLGNMGPSENTSIHMRDVFLPRKETGHD